MFGFLGEKLIPSISTSLSASYYFHQKNISKKRAKCLHNSIYPLIFAPRFGIEFVWLAVPAGWFANFLISYVALRKSWPVEKVD